MPKRDSFQILARVISTFSEDINHPLYTGWADACVSGENREPFLAEVVVEELAMGVEPKMPCVFRALQVQRSGARMF